MNKNIILSLILFSFILLQSQINAQSQQCKKWIQHLITDYQDIPLESIMYSGINPNSPGQQYQCLNIKSNNTNYQQFTYYLIYTSNFSTRSNTYTGICIPNNCTLEDLSIALQPYDSKVYQLRYQLDLDAWSIIGLIVLFGWIAVLVISSIWASCKQTEESESSKESMKQIKTSENEDGIHVQHKQSRKEDRGSVQTQAVENFHQDWKLFNYYAGYQKIFVQTPYKNMMSFINILATLGFAIAVQFSYKQQIAANYLKAPQLLKNVGGLFVCNTQIAFSIILFVLGLKLAYGIYKIDSFKQMGRYFFSQVLKKWIFLIMMTMVAYSVLNTINSPLRKIWQLQYGRDCPSKLWEYWLLFRNLQFDNAACLPWFSLPASQILFTILAVPIVILFRVSKRISNTLMFLFIIVSIIVGTIILDSSLVFYQPQKLFNNPWQFTFKYQDNPLVRMGAFFFGLFFGLFVVQGLQKLQNQPRKIQYKFAKRIKRNTTLQFIMHLLGFLGMFLSFISLISVLQMRDRSPQDDQSSIYAYLISIPLVFLISMMIFVLPIFWQAKGAISQFIKKILGMQIWVHMDRISFTFFILTPCVIGYTTFSMQSSIYYDANTLITYLIGDIFLIYLISLLVVAGIENQLVTLNAWLQTKVFGSHNQYSVLVVQQ